MATAERLYYDSPALEFTALVTDIRLDSREAGEALWQVALDRTAFYPEGGGQPWDTGLLIATARSGAVLEVPVERVMEDDAGEVWHYVRKPLVEGTEIVGRIDADRRLDHAQQHTGQHLLSAVFLRELGAKTVGFRLSALNTGTETVTIDLSLLADTDKLTDEDLALVETAANRVIYEDRALRPHWVSREEAEAMLARGELRKLPDRDGPMRIVTMAGVEHNACGGTHVASTGAIGSILIRRLEKIKQGQRVEFVCGLRAVQAARRDLLTLRQVSATLSVGPADVAGRVETLVLQTKQAGKERQHLLHELVEAEVFLLNARFVPGALIDAHYTKRDLAFVRTLANRLASFGRGAVLSEETDGQGSVILLRPPDADFHAGDFVKAFLKHVSEPPDLRGGGTAEIAQIVFKDCRDGSTDFYARGLANMVKRATGRSQAADH